MCIDPWVATLVQQLSQWFKKWGTKTNSSDSAYHSLWPLITFFLMKSLLVRMQSCFFPWMKLLMQRQCAMVVKKGFFLCVLTLRCLAHTHPRDRRIRLSPTNPSSTCKYTRETILFPLNFLDSVKPLVTFRCQEIINSEGRVLHS